MPKIEKYRRLACEARALAATSLYGNARIAFEQIADGYDSLADLAEERQALYGHPAWASVH